MTSSERHLNLGQPRWDYSIQKYKPFRDVFCEKGLFSILFLACGRSEVTRRCLLSTVDAVARSKQEVEWIFMENGQDDINYGVFNELPLQRKVVIRQRNFGINEAINNLYSISRGEFVLLLENDWELRSIQDFLSLSRSVLDEKKDVGIIQLRAIGDTNEQWGRGKAEYWPWDCSNRELENKNVKLWHEKLSDGFEYVIANHPNSWNNNPAIVRKQIYRECGPLEEPEIGTDPRHGETSMQERTAKLGYITAHIGEFYYHCGQTSTVAI